MPKINFLKINFKVICNEISNDILALSLNFFHKVAGLKRKTQSVLKIFQLLPTPSVLI